MVSLGRFQLRLGAWLEVVGLHLVHGMCRTIAKIKTYIFLRGLQYIGRDRALIHEYIMGIEALYTKKKLLLGKKNPAGNFLQTSAIVKA